MPWLQQRGSYWGTSEGFFECWSIFVPWLQHVRASWEKDSCGSDVFHLNLKKLGTHEKDLLRNQIILKSLDNSHWEKPRERPSMMIELPHRLHHFEPFHGIYPKKSV